MRIGELARAAGVSAKTVRFYEAKGILPHARRAPSGYRVYSASDADRLTFIRNAQRLGLTLAEIRSILTLGDSHRPTCVHVRSLLQQKLEDLERMLQGLTEFRGELQRLIRQSGALEDCRPTGGRICAIIEESELGLGDRTLDRARRGFRQPASAETRRVRRVRHDQV